MKLLQFKKKMVENADILDSSFLIFLQYFY